MIMAMHDILGYSVDGISIVAYTVRIREINYFPNYIYYYIGIHHHFSWYFKYANVFM